MKPGRNLGNRGAEEGNENEQWRFAFRGLRVGSGGKEEEEGWRKMTRSGGANLDGKASGFQCAGWMGTRHPSSGAGVRVTCSRRLELALGGGRYGQGKAVYLLRAREG
jgi:hypothetical protein